MWDRYATFLSEENVAGRVQVDPIGRVSCHRDAVLTRRREKCRTPIIKIFRIVSQDSNIDAQVKIIQKAPPKIEVLPQS